MFGSDTTHTNARIKHYLRRNDVQVSTKPIFLRDGCTQPPPRPKPINPKHNPARATLVSKKNALKRFQDIVDCNSFSHFAVFTFDGDKIDRYDPNVVYNKTRDFLSNASSRHGFAYLLVPEYHEEKDGRRGIHLHALCNLGDLSVERAVHDDGTTVFDKAGRAVFHLPAWKWGFSYLTLIKGDPTCAGNYCKKKIAESKDKIFGKWYLSSRDLAKKPVIETLDQVDYNSFRDPEKLARGQQYETTVCPGFSILTEKIPCENEEA